MTIPGSRLPGKNGAMARCKIIDTNPRLIAATLL
jgi:hypothetical protein